MKDNNMNIIIAESSDIIYEGLVNILMNSDSKISISRAGGLHEFSDIKDIKRTILINPSLVQNQIKVFLSLKKDLPGSQWIAITYSLYDSQLLSHFNGIAAINDPQEKIINFIRKFHYSPAPAEQSIGSETLSDRETDVLKLLVSGFSNKEIADKLFISINTVITHRKNISVKTGIKSVAGLTIFAVVNNLITLENY